MKKLSYLYLVVLSLFSCNGTPPTQFTEAVLNDTLLTPHENTVALKDVLNQHKGKTIMIDIWASWCPDCVHSLPQVKALQEQFTEVVFVFLSLDRSIAAWAHGIQKYNIKGEHYFLPKGKKSPIGNFAKINWIPRYMVVDKAGQIALFKATNTDDKKLLQALKK